MVRKFRILAAGTLALFLASLGGLSVPSNVAAQDKPTSVITPRMTVTQNGNLATFVILVRNNSTKPDFKLHRVLIKASIPQGTKVMGCWTAGPGQGTCKFTPGDQSVGWLNALAGRNIGPFIYVVDTGGKKVCSHYWIDVEAGSQSTQQLGQDVCTK